MENAQLGESLVAWRELTGLTQAELAEKSKVPRATITQIETGRFKPSTEALQGLAKAFGIGVLDLLTPPHFKIQNVRFRSPKPLKSRNELLAQITRDLQTYSELEELVGQKNDLKLIDDLSSQITNASSHEKAALIIRKALGVDSADQQQLIRDLPGLLEERAKLKILRVNLANADFFGLSVRDAEIGPAIAVNSWDRISIERQLFTLAHEFGHLLLHKDDYNPEEKAEEAKKEGEADNFAGYFLMPTKLFELEYNDAAGLSLFDRVLKLKKIFHVSYKAVLYRLARHYGKKDIWVKFQMECKRNIGRTLSPKEELFPCSKTRSEEFEELKAHDFFPDRKNRLVIKALEMDRISVSRAAEILDMDLGDFRELYRSVKQFSLENSTNEV